MPRVQVYLPDDLYALLKEGGMSASQLLQDAVRQETRRRELCATLDAYLVEMDELYGPASEAERAEADVWAAEVAAAVRRAADDEPVSPTPPTPPTGRATEPDRGRATQGKLAG
jgi:hypothetical protein